MDSSLQFQIQTLQPENFPSPTLFSRQIESKNFPAVFNGCVKDWAAFTKWNPRNGGLEYLEERVGSSTVEAMLSKSAPVFYGDLRSHERVPLPFQSFIGFCKQRVENTDVTVTSDSYRSESNETLLSGDDAQQIYLAQVPIMNAEHGDKVQLETLRDDIQRPTFLEAKELASINLWMNNAQSRSSTHYDPHHNLLCIVAGRKQVVLWPPSASPFLYPMPLYGEASNHSSVALGEPPDLLYPRAKFSMEYSQTVVLQAGDALFIPEGWFHQVDSDDLTIAVNFWWQSDIMSSMLEHMDAYYLRRILRRLTEKEMNQVLPKTSFPGMKELKTDTHEVPWTGEADRNEGASDKACEIQELKGKKLEQVIKLKELEPHALQALHELVSLVHDHVNTSSQNFQSTSQQSTLENGSAAGVKDEYDRNYRHNMFFLEDDPIAKVLWTVDPCALHDILLALAQKFPRTLEALILHLLSPVGAEVLTQKFDEMDQQTAEEDRNKFYKVFYGAFDDQFAAMDAILDGKEKYACQAFKNVLDKYLGVNSGASKSTS